MKPDLILVPVGPAHPGLLVQFTPEEFERHMRGVDREAAEILSSTDVESCGVLVDELGSDTCRCSRLWPLSPEALERARRWEEGLRK